MYQSFGISEDVIDLFNRCEKDCKDKFSEIDEACNYNSLKVLTAFHKNKVSEACFNSTTGYGYNDLGRETIENIFKDILGADDCLVRNQFISGSHALNVCFQALLRPGDLLLSISGKPYDTMDEVIGIKDNPSSLKSYGVKYDQIELVNDDFDYDKIEEYIKNNKVKVVEIQRSRGYSTRKSIDLTKIGMVIKLIKSIDKDVIIMVDNCYGAFVEDREPTEVGADVIASSFMKNLGSGIATSGGYIVGKKKYINLIAERLTAPGVGKDMGANFNVLTTYYKGLYFAPSVVAAALKTMTFAAYMLEKLNYKVTPKYNEERTDIIQVVELGSEEALKKFCEGLQLGGAIESKLKPVPCEMPGYPHAEMMAGSTFIPSATIELSCDGPIIPPYRVYMQGSLTYDYGKLGILIALNNMEG